MALGWVSLQTNARAQKLAFVWHPLNPETRAVRAVRLTVVPIQGLPMLGRSNMFRKGFRALIKISAIEGLYKASIRGLGFRVRGKGFRV